MSKISLPFWRDGEPFQPVIYPEDLANLQDEEEAALNVQPPRRPNVEVLHVYAKFIARILEQTFPGQKADMKLTVPEIRGAFVELWTKGQDWRENDRPLEQGGARSPPSVLQVSR